SRTPVVLVSPPTRKGREMTLLALDLGAAGVVRMPSRELVRRMPDVVSEMLGAVKAAARGRTEPDAATAEPSAASVIAVGASTGGTDAIQQFLMAMRPDAPGLVIVQHMPERFTHAAAAGEKAVGVILTGMGADGARGLSAMKRAGARTLAQDEATCVVFGMPREAIALGAVDHVLPLSELGRVALELCGPRPR